MSVRNLSSDEYNVYYQPYLDKVGEGGALEILKGSRNIVSSFLEGIKEEKFAFRYAEGKWTIKEVLLHLIDTERVFAYRALCIARKDQTKFSGFDQDDYVANSQANERSVESLLLEYKNVRSATISLFESFNDEALLQTGYASNSQLSVRAIAFIIVGHENHHLDIIKSRYL
ncbi:DinB family protein [uncultured Gelidibacter sp.]|uniref:DinB family protein n=1 Tax=uncultured Gelidibacter sp. TaxID=259318 RepID=UPI002631DBCF|nr:DinB family protein [uncultured Gelidibacter sp.]